MGTNQERMLLVRDLTMFAKSLWRESRCVGQAEWNMFLPYKGNVLDTITETSSRGMSRL